MTSTDRLNAWVRQCAMAPERRINRAEVHRALSIFTTPDQSFYVQSLPSAHWHECHGSRLDEAAKAAYNLSDGAGVYWTINPCKPGLASMPREKDVLARRWLLIDVDRRRVKGDPINNASEAEKLLAAEVTFKVSDWLWGLGWPNPVMADSGNGNHLYYRIDLPNDPLSRATLKIILANLKSRFDTPANEIDGVVIDARRISKIPGTWARKGPHTDDRPHRLARLILAPDPIEIVTIEQLQAAGGQALTPAPTAKPSMNGTPVTTYATSPHGDLSHYVQRAIELECGKVELAPAGDRNNQLNKSAHNLGTLAMWPEMLAIEARAALVTAACRAGLETDPNCGPIGLRRTIESGWTAGAAKPRPRPASTGMPRLKSAATNGTTESSPGPSPILWANTVKPRRIEWIWEQGIARRKLTTFAGVGGLGKTFLLCDIAARISQGAEWPFSGGLCAERGMVLFISGEDDPDDTLVPRLIELNADLSRIAFLTTEALDRFTLKDIAALDNAADHIGKELSFVVIDPPTAYLDGVDDHNNAQLRTLLTPLKNWVSRRNCGMDFNTHVNKSQGKIDAMMRVMGSVAWVNAVRSAHIIAKDPNDPNRRLFIPMKNNVGREQKGLAYRIVETPTLATVEWLGPVDTTADEAMSQERKKPRVRDACECLIEMFNLQLEWPGDLFWARLKENGVTRHGFDQARVKLDIPKARRTAGTDGDITYMFWVPPIWAHLGKNPKNIPN